MLVPSDGGLGGSGGLLTSVRNPSELLTDSAGSFRETTEIAWRPRTIIAGSFHEMAQEASRTDQSRLHDFTPVDPVGESVAESCACAMLRDLHGLPSGDGIRPTLTRRTAESDLAMGIRPTDGPGLRMLHRFGEGANLFAKLISEDGHDVLDMMRIDGKWHPISEMRRDGDRLTVTLADLDRAKAVEIVRDRDRKNDRSE